VTARLAKLPLSAAICRSATLQTEKPLVSHTQATELLQVSKRACGIASSHLRSVDYIAIGHCVPRFFVVSRAPLLDSPDQDANGLNHTLIIDNIA
jgi:hypothetical protein